MAAHPQSIQARAIRQSGRTAEVDTARAAEGGEAFSARHFSFWLKP